MPRSRSRSPQLDAPLGRGTPRQRPTSRDRFGRFTEWVARAMGTPAFLLILTLFCVLWICWNTLLPDHLRFDDAALGFTALTLMLSLQASYAAPLSSSRRTARTTATACRSSRIASVPSATSPTRSTWPERSSRCGCRSKSATTRS